MKDPRISIRLSAEEHTALKIITAKQNIKIQELLHGYIKNILKRGFIE